MVDDVVDGFVLFCFEREVMVVFFKVYVQAHDEEISLILIMVIVAE